MVIIISVVIVTLRPILMKTSCMPLSLGTSGRGVSQGGGGGGAPGARAPPSDQRATPRRTAQRYMTLTYASTLKPRLGRRDLDRRSRRRSGTRRDREAVYAYYDCLCVSNASGRSEVIYTGTVNNLRNGDFQLRRDVYIRRRFFSLRRQKTRNARQRTETHIYTKVELRAF